MPVIFKDRTADVVRQVKADVSRNLETDFAEVMVEVAKELSPIESGNNRDSINHRPISEFEIHVFTESGYGGFLELGTSRMAAQPYFVPAAVEADREFQRGMPWR